MKRFIIGVNYEKTDVCCTAYPISLISATFLINIMSKFPEFEFGTNAMLKLMNTLTEWTDLTVPTVE